jgi:hypothetical protein
LKKIQGDILKAEAEAWLIPVNCVGVMGLEGLLCSSRRLFLRTLKNTKLFVIGKS